MSVLLSLVKLGGIYFHNLERLKGEHHEEHKAIEHGERKEHGKGEEHIPPLALSGMGILGLIAAYLTGGERNGLSLNTPQSKSLLGRRSFRANPDANNLWFALIYEVAACALTRQNKTDFALVGKFFWLKQVSKFLSSNKG